MAPSNALFRQHPRRIDVPLMLIGSTGLLIAGYQLPTLTMSKAIFFTETYSIWAGVRELWQSSHYGLATMVFVFSMVFPVAKLIGLAAAWFVPLGPYRRTQAVKWIGYLGKWSMLDVFLVATLVVLIKAQDVSDASAEIGIYLFAASILLSIAAAQSVFGLARRESA